MKVSNDKISADMLLYRWDSQMMRDEVFGFLVAGHDTTGAVMEWTLKWLTAEQRVQKKLRSELQSVINETGSMDACLSAEKICKAKVC